MMKNHPFHMVTPSPWPIITSMNILTMILSSLNWIINKTPIMMMTSAFLSFDKTIISSMMIKNN